MVWLPVHPLANVRDVGKEGLLGALADDLGRDHGVLLAAALRLRVRLPDDPERPVQELLV